MQDSSASSPFAYLLGGPYIGPMEYHADLRPFRPQKYKGADPLPDTVFSTWLIEGEIFYTLFCIADPLNHDASIMVVYDHDSESIFYLRRELWPRGVPVNSAALAHFIWDNTEDGQVQPNFLLFDLVRWGGAEMIGVEPCKRYALLREIRLPENSVVSVHYVGEKKAVQAFLEDVRDGLTRLPHKVKQCVHLSDNPFRPFYE